MSCPACGCSCRDTLPAPPPTDRLPEQIVSDPDTVWGPEAITEVQVPRPLPDRAPPMRER